MAHEETRIVNFSLKLNSFFLSVLWRKRRWKRLRILKPPIRLFMRYVHVPSIFIMLSMFEYPIYLPLLSSKRVSYLLNNVVYVCSKYPIYWIMLSIHAVNTLSAALFCLWREFPIYWTMLYSLNLLNSFVHWIMCSIHAVNVFEASLLSTE